MLELRFATTIAIKRARDVQSVMRSIKMQIHVDQAKLVRTHQHHFVIYSGFHPREVAK